VTAGGARPSPGPNVSFCNFPRVGAPAGGCFGGNTGRRQGAGGGVGGSSLVGGCLVFFSHGEALDSGVARCGCVAAVAPVGPSPAVPAAARRTAATAATCTARPSR